MHGRRCADELSLRRIEGFDVSRGVHYLVDRFPSAGTDAAGLPFQGLVGSDRQGHSAWRSAVRRARVGAFGSFCVFGSLPVLRVLRGLTLIPKRLFSSRWTKLVIEFDHVKPFAKRGSADPQNIRLLRPQRARPKRAVRQTLGVLAGSASTCAHRQGEVQSAYGHQEK